MSEEKFKVAPRLPKGRKRKKEEIEILAKARLKKRRPKLTKKRVFLPAIAACILVFIGIYFAIWSMHYQSTDDAFVEGRIISVAPRVSGPVISLLTDDNLPVKKGDLLLEIDPNDYIVKLNQAEAKLAEAQARLKVSNHDVSKNSSNVNQAVDDTASAKSKLDFAQKDFTRYDEMYKTGVVSKQDYDRSSKDLEVSIANYNSASNRKKAMKSEFSSSLAKTKTIEAEIQRLEAEVEQAKLNLSYTKIYAPSDGVIASRSVEEGNYVQVGQPLLAVVPKNVWVVANFKEGQLTHMHPGQKAWITVDAYPDKKFKAHVDSIQRATGAKSSLFPPENAVGSYVKIVQRVPVKIVFDEDYSKYNIVPGMSVVPRVKIK
ncbi:HlyD family secretion protein [bacterium]|nr:HlyD family secretion protein [bacterium]